MRDEVDAHLGIAEASAERFLKFDFAETKDLCKQFLTLVSSILVFSITFSDRLLICGKATTRSSLVYSWLFLALAIVFAGIGLWFIFVAGSQATHRPEMKRLRTTFRWLSFGALNIAGLSFTSGIASLIYAAVDSRSRS